MFWCVGAQAEVESEKGPVSQPSQDSSEADPHFEVEQVEPVLLQPDGEHVHTTDPGPFENVNHPLHS